MSECKKLNEIKYIYNYVSAAIGMNRRVFAICIRAMCECRRALAEHNKRYNKAPNVVVIVCRVWAKQEKKKKFIDF